MGYSVAIKYTVEMITRDAAGQLHSCTAAEWRVGARRQVPGFGKPTVENLERYVSTFEASTQPKGCNAHLGVQTVVSAFIKDQRIRGIVSSYASPANQN